MRLVTRQVQAGGVAGQRLMFVSAFVALQEGYNNEKLEFFTHSRQKLDSTAYIVSHSVWFYAVSLGADLLLLALAIIERPAVPIHGFTPSLLVSGMHDFGSQPCDNSIGGEFRGKSCIDLFVFIYVYSVFLFSTAYML